VLAAKKVATIARKNLTGPPAHSTFRTATILNKSRNFATDL
jgi:hypothetical protein